MAGGGRPGANMKRAPGRSSLFKICVWLAGWRAGAGAIAQPGPSLAVKTSLPARPDAGTCYLALAGACPRPRPLSRRPRSGVVVRTGSARAAATREPPAAPVRGLRASGSLGPVRHSTQMGRF